MQNTKKNKKGLGIELLAIMVVGFVTLIFFAAWTYGIGLVNNELVSITAEDNATNISDAVVNTFSYYNTGLSYLGDVGAVILLAFILSTLIIGYFSQNNPALLFVYILMMVLFIIFSFYVSNAYEDTLNNEVIGGTLQGYSVGNHIMLHLPTYIIVIGVISMILMLGGILSRR